MPDESHPQLLNAWFANLKKASPESYMEVFEDQVHGWMTSRYVSASNAGRSFNVNTHLVAPTSTISTCSKSTFAGTESSGRSLHVTCEHAAFGQGTSLVRQLLGGQISFHRINGRTTTPRVISQHVIMRLRSPPTIGLPLRLYSHAASLAFPWLWPCNCDRCWKNQD
jgi:hypothetical protein